MYKHVALFAQIMALRKLTETTNFRDKLIVDNGRNQMMNCSLDHTHMTIKIVKKILSHNS